MKNLYMFLFVAFVFSLSRTYSQNYTWQLKQSGFSLGDPICVNNWDDNIIYYGSGNHLYRSTDRGETFSTFGNSIPGSSSIKCVLQSSYDESTFLVAIENVQQTMKTTDAGSTWTSTGSFSWYYYGVPIQADPVHPDTLYAMNSNQFMASYDFGSTWNSISTGLPFGSPCDIDVFPDQPNIIVVGDNGYGIARSTDYGLTWTHPYSTGGETPIIAIDKNIPGLIWATKWAGSGGFIKSTDYGATWVSIPYFNGKNMWGLSIAPQLSDYIINGEYSGNSYITHNGGNTWTVIGNPSSNYAYHVVDTSTVFAAFGSGLYKLYSPWFVPVELTSFTGKVVDAKVQLDWRTATETNNRGFEIERSADSKNFEQIGFVPGYGTSTQSHTYSYNTDLNNSDIQYFRLKQVDFDGTSEYSNIVEVNSPLPSTFSISQNYPNPFNPTTKISFNLPVDSKVKITVYNELGQKISDLTNQDYSAGRFDVNFAAGNLSSGLYFYVIEAKGNNGSSFVSTKKMMLLK
jgi:Secretion system C-terminal sorting domain